MLKVKKSNQYEYYFVDIEQFKNAVKDANIKDFQEIINRINRLNATCNAVNLRVDSLVNNIDSQQKLTEDILTEIQKIQENVNNDKIVEALTKLKSDFVEYKKEQYRTEIIKEVEMKQDLTTLKWKVAIVASIIIGIISILYQIIAL